MKNTPEYECLPITLPHAARYLRGTIKTGHLFFSSGNGWNSVKIKVITKADVSHVGICVWILDELFIIEASSHRKRVTITRFEDYFKNYNDTKKRYDGKIYIGEIEGFDEAQRIKFTKACLKHDGKFYDFEDFGDILYNASRFSKWLGKASRVKDAKLYCSELVHLGVISTYKPGDKIPADIAEFINKNFPFPGDAKKITKIICEVV